MSYSIILASSSVSRRIIMENAGIKFISVKSNIDERKVEKSLNLLEKINSAKIALILAERKALEVSIRYPDHIVIGCDQTMSLGDNIYHKPNNIIEAEQHLLDLSGKTHNLSSAYALVKNGKVLRNHISIAQLTMYNLSLDFIRKYLKKIGNKSLLSIGSYQIEKEGIQLFSSIKGSYFTVVGLPIIELISDLKKEKIID
ncbi:Maf family protein [Candidatus Liberibacter americanus]|uniref:Nucleoside triphosphate pyrophosphatase n=1 Tax=Candidatus Liberibacter americanus str. Sao Paulo TaxID=1261131 RepID=U6B6M1_9HYPH|nr:Maf family protein [Candidatus Liberibacter americanus]AHA27516.1 Septum formation protein Maf [Candidatus Liberibacter americanus str. Sao Paulo]EMS36522.1 Maf-like protein [Candidatus Liberibacter americanus PW_SP]